MDQELDCYWLFFLLSCDSAPRNGGGMRVGYDAGGEHCPKDGFNVRSEEG
jgi:hypothetical protein